MRSPSASGKLSVLRKGLPNHCSLFLQLLGNRPPTRHKDEYSYTNAQVPLLRGKESRMLPSTTTIHSSHVSSSLTSLMSEVLSVEWEALKMGIRKQTQTGDRQEDTKAPFTESQKNQRESLTGSTGTAQYSHNSMAWVQSRPEASRSTLQNTTAGKKELLRAKSVLAKAVKEETQAK